MPSSRVARAFYVLWMLFTLFSIFRALQEPETRMFFAVSIAVFAVPIAIGTIIAVVMLATAAARTV